MSELPDYSSDALAANRRVEALRIMKGLPKRMQESLVLAACDRAIKETGSIDRTLIVTHLMTTHPSYFGLPDGDD